MDRVCWSCFFLLSSFFPAFLPCLFYPYPLLPLQLSSSHLFIPYSLPLPLFSLLLFSLPPSFSPRVSFYPLRVLPPFLRADPHLAPASPPSVPGAVPALQAPPSIHEPTAHHRGIVPRSPPGRFPPQNPASPRCRISPGPRLVSREGKPCPARGDSPQNWVQGRLLPLPPCNDAVGGMGNNIPRALAGIMSRQPRMRLEC